MQPQVLENQVSYPSLCYLDCCLGLPNEHFCNYSTCVWCVAAINLMTDVKTNGVMIRDTKTLGVNNF